MTAFLPSLSGQKSSLVRTPAFHRGIRGWAAVLGVIFVQASLSGTGFAANGTWTASSGDWTNSGNWTPGIPGSADTAFFGNAPANAPVSVNVDGSQSISTFSFSNTSSRTYTFSGSAITFSHLGRILTGAAATSAITFNNDIIIGAHDTTSTVTIGGTQPSTSNFTTITFNGDILAGSGTGTRTLVTNSSATAQIILNGSNTVQAFTFGGLGELIVGNSSAFGTGGVTKTAASTLSLRSDVTVGGIWTQNNGSPYTYFRISEIAASSADRTLTLNDRIAGSNGAIEWIENINSTGNLILELKYSGGNVQSLALITNDTGVVRFAQSGNTTYSGIISGSGALEKAVGTGTTTLSAANSYTGKTTIAAGTLLLGVDGSIANSSEINLGTAGSQGTLNVTSKASFAFGTGQTVSGFGTINIGAGKTVSVAGNLNPGNSPGQVNVTGNLALENTTVTTMELAGDGGVKGTDFDNVTATGSLVYDGTLSIVSFGGFNIYQDGTYSLFDFASQSGNFDAVSFGGNALTYDAGIWSGSSGGSDFNFTLATGDLVVLGVIPEPGTAGLVALAAVSLLGLRRRGRLLA